MHLPGVSIRATHDIKFISIIQNFTKRCKRKTVSFYFSLRFIEIPAYPCYNITNGHGPIGGRILYGKKQPTAPSRQ